MCLVTCHFISLLVRLYITSTQKPESIRHWTWGQT